ncbi:thiamine phosphate synthase [Candidatus Zinderia endosymbiont of Aphrophora alni]|uniref:thiamine phosphate synthase n=1 Tax=Candidatus Zinderia endosymbiont of Aphrophora alni TaxID=3077951 RepID=UPI003BAF7315
MQYRNKISKKDIQKKQAIFLLKLCHNNNIPLIINNDIDLCIQINADGVHLGYKDFSIFEARYILGNKKIIGSSCYNSLYFAKKNFLNGANYISLGGFYFSNIKKYLFKTNLKLISLIKKKIFVPIVAIGGINKKNFLPLFKFGVDMIAIISSLYYSKNIIFDLLILNNIK